ncbi:PspA/IM30 family protein [Microbacterium sp. APC 3898]|uniref:PspA/IM30 family protein n=1 Tax=Planococcus notacanthi TaxID=3035188 RepID=A0ABT7ZMS0_9BACL|nr:MULTISPECIES: PspA/IM30 family protein [Terrabacteria group]MBF6632689.1 PspA/IM30 family protein [Planococcus sp. (in: firmicutes)]MDN3428444.1 PspA/IM30 family protein [Planococcus sp. APC 4016]MDN3498849.1 PspA/IM30 family protein [Microbacterium sp. APC 3898]
MEILKRFKDIMTSNINALLDKAEDPEKMIDQYLRDLNSDLGKVKSETAAIMAAEKRERRELEEFEKEIGDMQRYAVKALEAGNEDDARKFLQRKAELSEKVTDKQTAVELAAANTQQMRQMHDKLESDIGELESRRSELKGKASVAKTQKRMNDFASSVDGAGERISAFDKMEQKINQELDEAIAMSELNKGSSTDIKDLASKYDSDSSVDDELESLKAGINVDDELESLKSQLGKNE